MTLPKVCPASDWSAPGRLVALPPAPNASLIARIPTIPYETPLATSPVRARIAYHPRPAGASASARCIGRSTDARPRSSTGCLIATEPPPRRRLLLEQNAVVTGGDTDSTCHLSSAACISRAGEERIVPIEPPLPEGRRRRAGAGGRGERVRSRRRLLVRPVRGTPGRCGCEPPPLHPPVPRQHV